MPHCPREKVPQDAGPALRRGPSATDDHGARDEVPGGGGAQVPH